jgi:hypothetical protein
MSVMDLEHISKLLWAMRSLCYLLRLLQLLLRLLMRRVVKIRFREAFEKRDVAFTLCFSILGIFPQLIHNSRYKGVYNKIAVVSTNFLFATSCVMFGWWTFSCCGGEFDNLHKVVVEVDGECSVHHVLILVGRRGIHGAQH